MTFKATINALSFASVLIIIAAFVYVVPAEASTLSNKFPVIYSK